MKGRTCLFGCDLDRGHWLGKRDQVGACGPETVAPRGTAGHGETALTGVYSIFTSTNFLQPHASPEAKVNLSWKFSLGSVHVCLQWEEGL